MAARGQNQWNEKTKHAYAPKTKNPPLRKREDLAKDSICYECGETGHWKRNYPQYLAELLKKKKNATSGAGGGSGVKSVPLEMLCCYERLSEVEFIAWNAIDLRSRRLIGLCQSAYIDKILKGFLCHMENSKRGSILMQEKLRLSKSQGVSTPAELKRMQNVPYASVTLYAGNLLDADDLKSETGYVFVLNEGVVDWKSAKRSIFATSSVEAEYIAAFDASKEAVWVRKFISGLSVVPSIEKPINMYCDNTGAIAIANESGITKGASHFRAKVHYLREVIEYGDVKLEKVHTDDNLANPFTKALAFPKHSEHTKNIGMLPASSFM
ncbi:retrotransposon protein, putative, ty1-copia subclass [Tanacetum coccineum]